ncbi:MAG: DUF1573 domain-containing protein [Bacteroidetes bacterium]|nr:DUF1573 domain-containing protein [Bacteroidota bacterium]
MQAINRLKVLLLIGIVFMIIIACNNQSDNSDTSTTTLKSNLRKESLGHDGIPKISFERNEHDFGEIVSGEELTYAFKFTNNGGADLIIRDVKVACGCTVSEFPKEPIKPDGKGVIKLTLNSRGLNGYQNKTAVVETNTSPNKVFIRIKAMVKKS